eukprot:TRINITY_DN14256_c0_g1_i1.p1 TRINITY_DN14256_c0_g1~~TRINITY_DN14256_c0_g1_i1.p1  ORF type:complete len:120 (-),score=25.78 TRINITY_DN14256_c0_g1_i1:83-442(-)
MASRISRLRPTKALFSLSENAKERLKTLLNNKKNIKGIRVGVREGGCSGMKYTMEYAQEIKPTDSVVTEGDLTVLVDRKAELFVVGTELDWKQSPEKSEFVFQNPNAKSTCGCGDSFSV